MLEIISILYISCIIVLSKENGDRDCRWFGNTADTPIYPIGICSTYYHEAENDGMFIFSSKYECQSGRLWEYEYNDTDCTGDIANRNEYKANNGYYFNCDSDYECPYVKMKFYELYHANNTDEGECVIDTYNFEEYSIVTDICMQFYTQSFYVDCDASTVTMYEYNNSYQCGDNQNYTETIIEEGCDDPFEWNRYIQVKECKDRSYVPPDNTGSGGGGGGNDDSNNESDELAIIFTIIIALIIIVVAIMIGVAIIQKKLNPDMKSANLKMLQEPMHVTFDRLQDDENEHDDDNNKKKEEKKLFARFSDDEEDENENENENDDEQIISGGNAVDEITVNDPIHDDDVDDDINDNVIDNENRL